MAFWGVEGRGLRRQYIVSHIANCQSFSGSYVNNGGPLEAAPVETLDFVLLMPFLFFRFGM